MRLFYTVAAFALTTSLAMAQVNVVASIKPVHSLVASVMQGIGTPTLIVSGSGSPHTYTLKPSDAEALQNAEVIFWVGHELEAFLEKPLQVLGQYSKSVSLLDAPGILKLPPREGSGFETHEDAAEARDHEEVDGHIWLDPENAKIILILIADTLAEADAKNAAKYKANAATAAASIDAMSVEIASALQPVKRKNFIVFHDAYQYFENRFGLKASGALSINPENPPGAQAIAALRQTIADKKVQCVFSEPQFDNKLVNVIIEGSIVKSAVLDPEGADLDTGPKLYETLLRNLTNSLVQCLAP